MCGKLLQPCTEWQSGMPPWRSSIVCGQRTQRDASMAKAKTPSFISEFELQVDNSQERKPLIRMDVARQVYNACLGESLKRLGLMRQSKIYQSARKMRRGKKRTAAFQEASRQHKFQEYDLHAYAKQFNHAWMGAHLDS